MQATSRDHVHLPGCDDRVYLQLHGRRDRQDAVLVEYVPQLIGQLAPAQWWFVRYRDPHDHLRLRLTLPPGTLGNATVQIGAWTRRVRDAGLIARASWETHYPETARFGGPAAIETAEEYFAADSGAAIAQLTTLRSGLDRRAVLAASMADIAIALVGDVGTAMRWLIDHTRTEAAAPPRPLYDQALALIAGETSLNESISASWLKRRTALTAYRTALRAEDVPAQDLLADLLHLHHARVVGPDLQQERAALHLVRAAALSWNARTASKP
jgi:thiopeptide-type bacteriocin biosynthesis protein